MLENYNKQEYKIRSFKAEDYIQINNLWEQIGVGGSHRGDNELIINETIKNGGELFVLEYLPKSVIVGTAWITTDKRRMYLHHFGIKKEFQGKGLSNFLCEHCVNFAKNNKLQLKLEVHKQNQKAIELYKKFGFNYLGDYDVYIIRKY